MNKIKAVVFDMDGVILDSEKLWYNSVKKSNEEQITNVPLDLIIECIGKRVDYIDSRLKEVMGNDFDTDWFRNLNWKYMQEDINQNGLKVKKGFYELVDYLKKNNIKTAVASSSKIDKIKERLNLAKVDINIFDNVIGGDMVTESKPNPQIYTKSCEALGIMPQEVIAIEDSEYGIISASKAKTNPILIPDMKDPSEYLKDINYTKCQDLTEIKNIIEKINKN